MRVHGSDAMCWYEHPCLPTGCVAGAKSLELVFPSMSYDASFINSRHRPGELISRAARNAARCRRVIAPFHTVAIADNSRRVAQAVLPDILT